MRKTHNKDLPFVVDGWQGNPLDSKGRYTNLDGHSARGLKDVLKWKLFQSNPYAEAKKNQSSNVTVITDSDMMSVDKDAIIWLGHATFLLCLGGRRIIIDPILYDIWPLKRFTELPIDVDLLTGIDLILLSHNHRDHADENSMKKITSLNPDAVIYTGLEIGELLRGWDITNDITEAGWYQKYPPLGKEIDITYLPAKHWNRRFLNDLNEMLWGSFMIRFGDRNIYFGADSGLGDHFSLIGKMYDIDIAMIGIGAYEPVWFMRPSHTSPNDALQVMADLGARQMIPMHYGTFDLSDEPISNPKEILQELIKGRNDIHINAVGERWWFV